MNVRNGAAVRIGAGGIGENAGETRRRRARQSDADPRLNYRVTTFAHFRRRVDLDPVQRMRNRFDQPSRRFNRKLRIGVERDHERDRQRECPSTRISAVAIAA